MTAPTCILAPFGAPTAARRKWHTARAEACVTLLHREGALGSACIHSSVLRGVYGDDTDPEARARGLEASARFAALFPRCFVLLRDDGSKSAGTRADEDAWCLAHPGVSSIGWCWSDLRDRFEAAGMLDVWAGLVEAPDVAGVWRQSHPRAASFRRYATRKPAAVLTRQGWYAYDADGREIARGPETGPAGRAAADAALRAAGVEVRDV